MRNFNLKLMVAFILAFLLFGCPENLLAQMPGEEAGGPQLENNSQGGAQGLQQGVPGQRDGVTGQQRPPVHPLFLYIGHAVKAENEFEIACVNIFPNFHAEKNAKIKKPAGVIEVGKQTYFIVEANIETQEASLQLFPEQAKASGRKPPAIIKSCTAKVSGAYFETPNEPPAPGQADKMKMPEGKADIIGDIKIASVEKEAGKRKMIMVSGSVTINGEKYSLYLEPRVINPGMNGGPKNQNPNQNQGRNQNGMEPGNRGAGSNQPQE
ncbi:MAG: hypothetical protein QMC67_05070 [Candidatus Wallbacteria bacterium]